MSVGTEAVVDRSRPTLYGWYVGVQSHGLTCGAISRSGRFGFRTAEWRDGVFYLNGEPRYLKGALLQPTYPRSAADRPPGDLGDGRDVAAGEGEPG